jgi:hypothetical protein
MELRFVANFLPALMVSILFASTRVARRSLNVTVRDRTNPDVAIRRWNCERFDAPKLALIPDELSIRIEIGEVAAMRFARNAGPRVVDVTKPGIPGGFEIE